VSTLDEHPEAGSAAAKLLDYYDRDVIDGAGDIFLWSGVAGRRGHGQRDLGQYDQPRSIFGACGGAAIYRREAFETVGLLDGDFFAFYEDVDWSFRAQLAGFTCRYAPTAVAYHMGGATVAEMSDFSRYHIWRNGIWIALKDYPLSLLFLQLPRLLARQLENLRVAIREGKLRLLWRVWRDSIRAVPRLLRKRADVQSIRRVSLDRLASVIGESR
jgi:GT2 family glycosyltransferase